MKEIRISYCTLYLDLYTQIFLAVWWYLQIIDSLDIFNAKRPLDLAKFNIKIKLICIEHECPTYDLTGPLLRFIRRLYEPQPSIWSTGGAEPFTVAGEFVTKCYSRLLYWKYESWWMIWISSKISSNECITNIYYR